MFDEPDRRRSDRQIGERSVRRLATKIDSGRSLSPTLERRACICPIEATRCAPSGLGSLPLRERSRLAANRHSLPAMGRSRRSLGVCSTPDSGQAPSKSCLRRVPCRGVARFSITQPLRQAKRHFIVVVIEAPATRPAAALSRRPQGPCAASRRSGSGLSSPGPCRGCGLSTVREAGAGGNAVEVRAAAMAGPPSGRDDILGRRRCARVPRN